MIMIGIAQDTPYYSKCLKIFCLTKVAGDKSQLEMDLRESTACSHTPPNIRLISKACWRVIWLGNRT